MVVNEAIAILICSIPVIGMICYICFVWGYHVGTKDIYELKKELKEANQDHC